MKQNNYFSGYIDYRVRNKASVVSYWVCVLGTVALEIYGLILFLSGGYSQQYTRDYFLRYYFIFPIACYVAIGLINTGFFLLFNRRSPLLVAYAQMFCFVLMISVVVIMHLLSTIFAAFAAATVLSMMYNNRRLTLVTALLGIISYVLIALIVIPARGSLPPHDIIDMIANIIILSLTWFLGMRFMDSCDRLVEKIVKSEVEKEELIYKIKRDALTGLYNHAAFYSHLDEMILRNRREGLEFSIIIYDIDNFKKVNDTYGHALGDTVLLGVASIFEKYEESEVQPHRYGGEEFTLLVTGAFSKASEIADELREAFAAMPFYKNDKNHNAADALYFTMSGGVARWDEAYGGRREFFAAADELLYKAKQSGKNKVCGKSEAD